MCHIQTLIVRSHCQDTASGTGWHAVPPQRIHVIATEQQATILTSRRKPWCLAVLLMVVSLRIFRNMTALLLLLGRPAAGNHCIRNLLRALIPSCHA